MDKYLIRYIVIGALLGYFFGGVWLGIIAFVFIYSAQKLHHFVSVYEKVHLKKREENAPMPVEKEVFEVIYQFFKEKDISFEEVLKTPFEHIYAIKMEGKPVFLEVINGEVSIVRQDDIRTEWIRWLGTKFSEDS